jgi:hypothetical protein
MPGRVSTPDPLPTNAKDGIAICHDAKPVRHEVVRALSSSSFDYQLLHTIYNPTMARFFQYSAIRALQLHVISEAVNLVTASAIFSRFVDSDKIPCT